MQQGAMQEDKTLPQVGRFSRPLNTDFNVRLKGYLDHKFVYQRILDLLPNHEDYDAEATNSAKWLFEIVLLAKESDRLFQETLNSIAKDIFTSAAKHLSASDAKWQVPEYSFASLEAILDIAEINFATLLQMLVQKISALQVENEQLGDAIKDELRTETAQAKLFSTTVFSRSALGMLYGYAQLHGYHFISDWLGAFKRAGCSLNHPVPTNVTAFNNWTPLCFAMAFGFTNSAKFLAAIAADETIDIEYRQPEKFYRSGGFSDFDHDGRNARQVLDFVALAPVDRREAILAKWINIPELLVLDVKHQQSVFCQGQKLPQPKPANADPNKVKLRLQDYNLPLGTKFSQLMIKICDSVTAPVAKTARSILLKGQYSAFVHQQLTPEQVDGYIVEVAQFLADTVAQDEDLVDNHFALFKQLLAEVTSVDRFYLLMSTLVGSFRKVKASPIRDRNFQQLLWNVLALGAGKILEALAQEVLTKEVLERTRAFLELDASIGAAEIQQYLHRIIQGCIVSKVTPQNIAKLSPEELERIILILLKQPAVIDTNLALLNYPKPIAPGNKSKTSATLVKSAELIVGRGDKVITVELGQLAQLQQLFTVSKAEEPVAEPVASAAPAPDTAAMPPLPPLLVPIYAQIIAFGTLEQLAVLFEHDETFNYFANSFCAYNGKHPSLSAALRCSQISDGMLRKILVEVPATKLLLAFADNINDKLKPLLLKLLEVSADDDLIAGYLNSKNYDLVRADDILARQLPEIKAFTDKPELIARALRILLRHPEGLVGAQVAQWYQAQVDTYLQEPPVQLQERFVPVSVAEFQIMHDLFKANCQDSGLRGEFINRAFYLALTNDHIELAKHIFSLYPDLTYQPQCYLVGDAQDSALPGFNIVDTIDTAFARITAAEVMADPQSLRVQLQQQVGLLIQAVAEPNVAGVQQLLQLFSTKIATDQKLVLPVEPAANIFAYCGTNIDLSIINALVAAGCSLDASTEVGLENFHSLLTAIISANNSGMDAAVKPQQVGGMGSAHMDAAVKPQQVGLGSQHVGMRPQFGLLLELLADANYSQSYAASAELQQLVELDLVAQASPEQLRVYFNWQLQQEGVMDAAVKPQHVGMGAQHGMGSQHVGMGPQQLGMQLLTSLTAEQVWANFERINAAIFSEPRIAEASADSSSSEDSAGSDAPALIIKQQAHQAMSHIIARIFSHKQYREHFEAITEQLRAFSKSQGHYKFSFAKADFENITATLAALQGDILNPKPKTLDPAKHALLNFWRQLIPLIDPAHYPELSCLLFKQCQEFIAKQFPEPGVVNDKPINALRFIELVQPFFTVMEAGLKQPKNYHLRLQEEIAAKQTDNKQHQERLQSDKRTAAKKRQLRTKTIGVTGKTGEEIDRKFRQQQLLRNLILLSLGLAAGAGSLICFIPNQFHLALPKLMATNDLVFSLVFAGVAATAFFIMIAINSFARNSLQRSHASGYASGDGAAASLEKTSEAEVLHSDPNLCFKFKGLAGPASVTTLSVLTTLRAPRGPVTAVTHRPHQD